ncbi:MAG: spermidine/putrescine ABC transporter permease [Chloroflexi bacterium]|nr:MAG: spermidine/putrescine ABC transporter permease [Chloroflexota bacterium]
MGRLGLRLATGSVLAFLYIPLVIIFLFAFNADRGQSWPIRSYTVRWFGDALANGDVRDALLLSVEAALGATAISLLLGSLAALAVHRFRFFGRETISFALVLPLALPGIVTGMALNATINTAGIGFGLVTIIVGHATFCIVVVYNNILARLRRTSSSIEEASLDLGATTWQTFRYVTLPVLRTAILAGALLAFALSFDEVIVTTFTAGTDETLPIWILNHLRQPNQRPIVNVVAVAVIVLSAVPVYLSQRLSASDAGGLSG